MTKKILWLSNSPTAKTGYGVQSTIVYDLRDKLGYQIIGQAFYGVQGAPIGVDGITWLPSAKDPYGNDTFPENYKMTNCDMMISLIDAWVLHPQATSKVRWIPYMPVDCHPLPIPVINSIRTAYRIIAYSEFGVRELKKAGFQAYYVPHFVDSRYFFPLSEEEKQTARKEFGIPEDAFVITIVAANKGTPSRKAFDAQLRAIGEFMSEHPNTYLILHTDISGGYNGEPIEFLINLANIPTDHVRTPNQFQLENGLYGYDYMNAIYNVADVTMNMTRGEGFGVPIIESVAAGTPVIVTEHSAMTELGQESNGWVVKPDAEAFMFMGLFAIPSIKGGVQALKAAYNEKEQGTLKERIALGRERILAKYERQKVVENYWQPVLAEISASIEAKQKFLREIKHGN